MPVDRLSVLLLAVAIACALGVVTAQHRARKLFMVLQQEQARAQDMDVEWGQLQLELSTWATPARVERIAAQKLHMQMPAAGSVHHIRIGQPEGVVTQP
jgi:cell division protein FtsL